jgi:hypothetical protein
MSERSNQPDEAAELPPIPDGGLAKDFPDWLRERPRWATATTPHEADTSAIDPRELVSLEDFPDWLQAIATDVEARQHDSTLPDLDPVVPGDGGEPAEAIVDTEPPETTDDPEPGVASVAADQPVRADVPSAMFDGAATGAEPPFPRYITPPAAMRQPSDGPRTFDPWLVGLVGAAIGIVVATILFLLIQ